MSTSREDVLQALLPIVEFTHNNKIEYSQNSTTSAYTLNQTKLVASTADLNHKTDFWLEQGNYKAIGHDLVADCVNPIYAINADPLFFINYLISEIDFKVPLVMSGIANALKKIDVPILKEQIGEILNSKEIAGHGVAFGIANESEHFFEVGDSIYAFPANGIHSGSFAYIKELQKEKDNIFKKTSLKQNRIYHEVYDLRKNVDVKGIAYIDRSFKKDLEKILPNHFCANINYSLELFTSPYRRIYKHVKDFKVMFDNFNMGIGLIVIAPSHQYSTIKALDPNALKIGTLEPFNNIGQKVYIPM